IYNGHDKTFFFFNWEQYRETQRINNLFITVPTDAYRNGDFGAAITGRTLGNDPLGRPIPENAIYDPDTTKPAPDGRIIRDQFTNNQIPTVRMDSVALKIQALIPHANIAGAGLLNNAVF